MPSTRLVRTIRTAMIAASFALAAAASAQVVLFDNGAFVTDPGAGFNGADVSRTQTGIVIALGNNALLAPPQGPGAIADDFMVTGGPWQLSTMTWYAIGPTQSGEFSTENRFDLAHVQIFDGSPLAGGTVIAGDQTTNRFVSGEWSGVYRTSSAASQLQAQSRPIMAIEIDMSWVPPLPDGHYYLSVGISNSASPISTVFAAPIPQVVGVHNAEQFFNNWISLPIDFPFILKGDAVTPCPADFNGDSFVNPDDLADFITCFFLDVQFPGFCPGADFNADTSRDPDDLADFITTFFLAVQFGC